jgi:hypothetical protein
MAKVFDKTAKLRNNVELRGLHAAGYTVVGSGERVFRPGDPLPTELELAEMTGQSVDEIVGSPEQLQATILALRTEQAKTQARLEALEGPRTHSRAKAAESTDPDEEDAPAASKAHQEASKAKDSTPNAKK